MSLSWLDGTLDASGWTLGIYIGILKTICLYIDSFSLFRKLGRLKAVESGNQPGRNIFSVPKFWTFQSFGGMFYENTVEKNVS